MTIRTIIEFADAVNSDPELANGLIAAVGKSRGDEAAEAFAAYACAHGFAVTAGEVVSLQRAARGDGNAPLAGGHEAAAEIDPKLALLMGFLAGANDAGDPG